MTKESGHHLLGHIPKENDVNNPENRMFIFYVPRTTHRFATGYTRNYGHWRFVGEWIKKIHAIDVGKLLEGKDFITYKYWKKKQKRCKINDM